MSKSKPVIPSYGFLGTVPPTKSTSLAKNGPTCTIEPSVKFAGIPGMLSDPKDRVEGKVEKIDEIFSESTKNSTAPPTETPTRFTSPGYHVNDGDSTVTELANKVTSR